MSLPWQVKRNAYCRSISIFHISNSYTTPSDPPILCRNRQNFAKKNDMNKYGHNLVIKLSIFLGCCSSHFNCREREKWAEKPRQENQTEWFKVLLRINSVCGTESSFLFRKHELTGFIFHFHWYINGWASLLGLCLIWRMMWYTLTLTSRQMLFFFYLWSIPA